jgi:hypothetical protein
MTDRLTTGSASAHHVSWQSCFFLSFTSKEPPLLYALRLRRARTYDCFTLHHPPPRPVTREYYYLPPLARTTASMSSIPSGRRGGDQKLGRCFCFLSLSQKELWPPTKPLCRARAYIIMTLLLSTTPLRDPTPPRPLTREAITRATTFLPSRARRRPCPPSPRAAAAATARLR